MAIVLNATTLNDGLNIKSKNPIDSRTLSASIDDIYLSRNWIKGKTTLHPYAGLIVSSQDGQVKICINTVGCYAKPVTDVQEGVEYVEYYGEKYLKSDIETAKSCWSDIATTSIDSDSYMQEEDVKSLFEGIFGTIEEESETVSVVVGEQ